MSKIAVLPGDGIGHEVTAAAQRVLAAAIPSLRFTEAPIGAAAIALGEDPLPAATLTLCEHSDAILFGAVGGPGFDHLPPEKRPEAALLRLRKHFDLFANVRPVRLLDATLCPLKGVAPKDVDFVVIRENTEGVYTDAGGVFKQGTADEIAIRLKYRVVTIHSFPNGNGRHGRMLAHIAMVRHFGLEPLPWGGSALRDPDAKRKAYIDALVAADHRNLAPLLSFARSGGS